MKRTCGALIRALCLSAAITGPALSQTPRDLIVESKPAVDFRVKTVGALSNSDWVLSSNGYIESPDFIVPNAISDTTPATAWITAYGDPAGNKSDAASWPEMKVYFDDVLLYTGYVRATSKEPLVIPVRIDRAAAGMHRIRIDYTNDALIDGNDRNLYVRGVEIKLGIGPSLPRNSGAFPKQSLTMQGGFFAPDAEYYGTTVPCEEQRVGCRKIRFAKSTGATDITFTTVCLVQRDADWCAPQINHGASAEEAALRVAIKYARSLGLSVTLKPFVLAPNGEVLAGYQAPMTNQKWLPGNPYEFFDSIEANLVHHARIAREEGVGLLMLGTEFGGRFTSGVPMNGYTGSCDRWKTVIANVRNAAAAVPNPPPGSPAALELTYAPTFAGFWNDLDANEAPYVCFWDRLDYFGLNAYPHMNYTPQATPVEQLVSGFNVYRRMFTLENVDADADNDFAISPTSSFAGAPLNFQMPLPGYEAFHLGDPSPGGYQSAFRTHLYSSKWYVDFVIDQLNSRFQSSLMSQNKFPMKALITEAGAPSSRHSQQFWGDKDLTPYQPSDSLYQIEQARALDGFIRAFYGDPRIAGVALWGLLPNHDANYGPIPDWYLDYDFSGKPAAEVVCRWFKRTYTSGTCLGQR